MNDKERNSDAKHSNMGLALALGAGLGIVFGKFVFDDVGVGFVIGAGMGVVFGFIKRAK